MDKRYIIIIMSIVFLLSVTTVCAETSDDVLTDYNQDSLNAVETEELSEQNNDNLNAFDTEEISQSNTDEKLEETYFYNAGTGEEYKDDTVITHNVVKYYGDTDKKFTVKVYDEDYNLQSGVAVNFGIQFEKTKEKVTNSKGIVKFPINYKPGTYDVETRIDCEGNQNYFISYNTVKVKSTIPTKELVKFSSQKKKFQIKFLDKKGKNLAKRYVKFIIKGKTYKVKTNKKGIAKISLNSFKVGKYKITAKNPATGEKRRIPVVILKKGVHKINIRIDDPTDFFPTKKLKNGDYIDTVYETKYRQYDPGVYVQASAGGLELAKHTKLLKAKFFFKNKKTGKIITKTSKKVKYQTIVVKPIKGYSPYKATVWYRDKK